MGLSSNSTKLNMSFALELKNISYSYKNKQALKNVNLSIKEGSFFVLLGLNAAGKSTIFSLITRLLSLQNGDIFINSYSIKNYKKALLSVGIVFQEPTLDLDLSVRQNLYYYGCMQGLNFKETMNSIKQEIQNLDLENKLDIYVRDLNSGHRRRVEILRALINEPNILLLDEATVGLDIKSRFEIIKYIRNIVEKRNISVLWITHLFDELENTDSIAIIKDGNITEEGILKDILLKHGKNSINEVFTYLNDIKL